MQSRTNELPILYTFRRCPYAMRARMAMALAGADAELREVRLRSKPEELRRVSPKATVPVLDLRGGEVLEESVDIMRWALQRSSGPELETWRRDALEPPKWRAYEADFKLHLDRYKYASRHEDADPEQERAAALACLEPLIRELAHSETLHGDRSGFSDYYWFPFVRQFAHVDRTWFAEAAPELLGWYQRLHDSSIFRRIMVKLDPWQPGDAPLTFAAVFQLEAEVAP